MKILPMKILIFILLTSVSYGQSKLFLKGSNAQGFDLGLHLSHIMPGLDISAGADSTIRFMNTIGATTHLYPIYYENQGWRDLVDVEMFKYDSAGIDVWVYLRPASETGSEPFDTNFVAWADTIAKLSLVYPHLKGYMIDDFWNNVPYNPTVHPDHVSLTPAYVDSFVTIGKAINPDIKFYPLLYAGQYGNVDVFDYYLPIIDGAVIGYPGYVSSYLPQYDVSVWDSLDIIQASVLTNTDNHPFHVTETISVADDSAFAYRNIIVTDAGDISITVFTKGLAQFYYKNDIIEFRVKIDDVIAFQKDMSDSTLARLTTIDLTSALSGKDSAKLSVGVYNTTPPYATIVNAAIAITDLTGATWSTASSSWAGVDTSGSWTIHIPTTEFDLDLIAMPYGIVGGIYTTEYYDTSTVENVSRWINRLGTWWLAGDIQGIAPFGIRDSAEVLLARLTDIYSAFNNDSIKTNYYFLPPTPTLTDVVASADTNTLTYSSYGDTTFIYRDWQTSADSLIGQTTSMTTYVDSGNGLVNDQDWYYRIRVKNTTGLNTTYSNQDSVIYVP